MPSRVNIASARSVLSKSRPPVGRDKHPNRSKRATMQQKLSDTVLIVNPNSCSGLTGKGWDALYPKIKHLVGENAKISISQKSGDGTTLARQFLKQGFKNIVAIGGDGTLNEVANGFFEEQVGINMAGTRSKALKSINPDALMAVVSCGTRNVLAKSLGLPEGVVECCRTFSLGRPRKLDVIRATVTDMRDRSTRITRIFLNAAEIGVGAEIIDRSKKVREVVNSRIVSTITSIIATVPGYQSNECEISIDNRRKIVAKMTMGIVANGKFLGGGFKSAPEANMLDGLLDVVIMKDSGSLKLLDELFNLKGGDYSKEGNVLYRQGRKVSIASRERDVTVTVDGEPIGILPAKFEVLPAALTIRM
jgi:diacylglycerol kinase (ATP)